MIIVVFGLPGSGKSYFATRLAKKLYTRYISSDKLRKEMFPVRTYSLVEKMAVYERMHIAMKEAIQNKTDLVLDGSFYKESIRKLFKDEIAARNQILYFMEVVAEESFIRERLSKPRVHSEADFGVYKKIKGEWEPMKEDHLIIRSTNDNIQDMVRTAEEYLHKHHDSNRNR